MTPTASPSKQPPVAPPEDRRSLVEMAAATPASRNRAIDFYRACSMLVVALGHWLGMVLVMKPNGKLLAGNALELVPSLWPVTWAFQVMPLFFFVGGYASASSLSAAQRDGVPPADWVATRLRRMLAPAVVLAGFWAVALAIAAVLGAKTIAMGAVAAAIPLWFLANYIIDTAAAPYTYRWFTRHPARVTAVFAAVFLGAEAANLAGISKIPQINWVIGWMGFQIAGFAWKENLLPTGKRLWAAAAAAWLTAALLVGFGPWPAPMLHHGGLKISPTHPPSLAFVAFGFAYSLTAASFAPALSRWLASTPKAWKATVAANGVAMSVYLWHMTAAAIYSGVLIYLGAVPQVAPGSSGFWLAKIPLVAVCVPILAVIVSRVMGVERRALLAPKVHWERSTASLMLAAALASVAVKMWSAPNPEILAAGIALLLIVWFAALRRPGTAQVAKVRSPASPSPGTM